MRSKLRECREGELSVRVSEPTPLASVIVVCFNSQDTLARCLRQLLDQDHPNYEVIVVDDGSTDGTAAVAEAASSEGPLKLVRAKRNRGCPAARNLGLREARGEVVAFVDADGFAAADWLRQLTACFDADPSIGGAASTVFFDDNPLVLNGAGGTVNRQGWAADLSMNESYEGVEIVHEALYPMGCGMAIRREALARVGPFDDRMLNYYDDVDFGIRLWRAGYRVTVAADAWIDHGLSAADGDNARKRLLCERHRMRVVLKHAVPSLLPRWAAWELRSLRDASMPLRAQKLRAIAWNVCKLPSAIGGRRRLRGARDVPEGLIDRSWGDGFPAGLPQRLRPAPERARACVETDDPDAEGQLLYGWFPVERVGDWNCRWAGKLAAVLIRVEERVKWLRLEYAHVPVDIGTITARIRRAGSPDPLSTLWQARLPWQYIARSIENHPLDLPPGDYEIVFSVEDGWAEPPEGARSLAFALARLALEPAREIVAGGLGMASPTVENQLVSGWFAPEQGPAGSYRWGARHAAAVVRLEDDVETARLSYRLPPGVVESLSISARALDGGEPRWSARIARRHGEWQEESLPLRLPRGSYLVSFDADSTWSNPEGEDPGLPAENRALGFAVADLRFA